MRLPHWLAHRWSPWQNATATYSPDPLLRWAGVTEDYRKPIQVRECETCKKREIRELEA